MVRNWHVRNHRTPAAVLYAGYQLRSVLPKEKARGLLPPPRPWSTLLLGSILVLRVVDLPITGSTSHYIAIEQQYLNLLDPCQLLVVGDKERSPSFHRRGDLQGIWHADVVLCT